jgi:hypothetical protein
MIVRPISYDSYINSVIDICCEIRILVKFSPPPVKNLFFLGKGEGEVSELK